MLPRRTNFNGVYSRNYLPKVKDAACIISLYVNSDNVAYFRSFGIEYIPK